jgi:hypothetical protein
MGRWAILNGLLGLIVALLALEIVRTWARELPPVDPAGKVSARAAAPEKHEKGKHGVDKATAKAEATPPVLVAAIEAKDLFDPSRQKAPLEEVKVTPPPPKETGPPPGVTVVGFRLFGSDREAFVTDSSQTQGSQQRRLRTGDQIGGYSVKRIEATGLVLTSPSGDEVTMPLVVEKGKSTPQPGRPAPTQKAAAQPVGSPAAGVIQGTSPSAGVQPPKPPQAAVQRPQGQVPPAVAGAPPVPGAVPAQAVPPAAPPDVRNRLEKLREHQAGARMGRNKQR